MLALTLVVLVALIAQSEQAVYTCDRTASCGCSKNPATVSRIVGGEDAVSATWGWAVSLNIDSGLCAGSILSDSWIITAAHCLVGIPASQVSVYAGSTARFGGSQTRAAARLIVHSGFNPNTFEDDIALIQLTTPLNMSDPSVSAICLPPASSSVSALGEWPPANTSVVAVGWGRLETDGALPLSLQQVTVQTVDYRTSGCKALLTNWRVQLCAGVPGSGKDTCQGDSGGPLMMFNTDRQWELIGLTSTGSDCASQLYPGVYTRVNAYDTWIKSNTNDTLWTTRPHTSTVSSTMISTRASSITLSISIARSTATTRSNLTSVSTMTTRPVSNTASSSTTRLVITSRTTGSTSTAVPTTFRRTTSASPIGSRASLHTSWHFKSFCVAWLTFMVAHHL